MDKRITMVIWYKINLFCTKTNISLLLKLQIVVFIWLFIGITLSNSQAQNVFYLETEAIQPRPNAIQIRVDTCIQVRFSQTPDMLSVNPENFLVLGTYVRQISGTFSFDNQTVKFRPSKPFNHGENIQVILTNRIQSLSGLSLNKSYSFRFSTEVVFTEPNFVQRPLGIGGQSESVFVADFDNDEDLDVVAAYRQSGKIVWFQNPSFSKEIVVKSDPGSEVNFVHAADINRDGYMDILASFATRAKIVWFQNDGSGNFEEKLISQSKVNRPSSVWASDLDGDGDNDVLGTSFNDGKLILYQNDGEQNFSEIIIDSLAPRAEFSYSADLDGDFDLDIILASLSRESLNWYENIHNQAFIPHNIVSAKNQGPANIMNLSSVYACDLGQDGKMDILAASITQNKVLWFEKDSNALFTKQGEISPIQAASYTQASDLNGDGFLDILTASKTGARLIWYQNDGNKRFIPKQIEDTSLHELESILAVDVDRDGDLDILGASSKQLIWFMNEPLPQPAIKGDSSVCTNLAYVYESLYVPGHTYNWTIEGGKIIGPGDSSHVEIVWNTPGVKALNLSQFSEVRNLKEQTKQQIIIYNPPEPSITGEQTVCTQREYTYSTPPSGNLFKWEIEGGKIMNYKGIPTNTIRVKWQKNSSIHRLILTEKNRLNVEGCETIHILEIQVIPLLHEITIQIPNHIYQLCPNEALKLEVIGNEDMSESTWYKEGVTRPLQVGRFMHIQEGGRYFVQLQNACESKRSQVIEIIAYEVYVPNFFSPNGDGQNETFQIYYKDLSQISSAKLRISDVHGRLVYAAEGVEEVFKKAWDGAGAPPQVFVWELEVYFNNACACFCKKGSIALSR